MNRLSIPSSLIVSLLFFISIHSAAQEIGVDRKSKSVFTYYSKDDSRVSLTADANLSYSQIFGTTIIHYYDTTEHKDTTVIKFRCRKENQNLCAYRFLFDKDDTSADR